MKKKTARGRAKKSRPRKASTKASRKTRVATARGSLHLKNGLGHMASARSIAKSIKRAADAGTSLEAASFQAAMAAVAYLIQHLEKQLERLHAAKDELRVLYGQMAEEEPDRRLRLATQSPAPRRQRRRRRGMDLSCAVAS